MTAQSNPGSLHTSNAPRDCTGLHQNRNATSMVETQ
ncbi:hypothetical protein ID866_8897 [Astraeus odoratus]|nr:hypothetical protein ID866_8897 [Astraeus odoratus]